jgi:hypothetical protein
MHKSKAVATINPDNVPASVTVPTPMTLLEHAVRANADITKLQQLMDLQERWEKNEARKAFVAALSAFRSEGIVVGKDSRVTYKTDKGVTDYTHASLGNICDVIGPALAKHGLSYRWDTRQEEGRITVTCILSHEKGHSESTSLSAGADSSGGKNAIQAMGSAVAYLERYTLTAITGTATKNQDNDGITIEQEPGMDDGQLADFLASIEAATNTGEVARAYLKSIEAASEIKDQAAMDKLNSAKNSKLEALKL